VASIVESRRTSGRAGFDKTVSREPFGLRRTRSPMGIQSCFAVHRLANPQSGLFRCRNSATGPIIS
jgi:hypothetical protein